MNIDYGQILKNATARQQALELLEAKLSEVNLIMDCLALAEIRMRDLVSAYKLLDQEGRSLLGPLNKALGFIERHIAMIREAQDNIAIIKNTIYPSNNEES